MIFKQELVDRILAGEKTQTRRPVKYEHPVDGPIATVAVPCRYKVGRTYAVQPGRGEKGVARIRVTDVRRERWKYITEADALAEGFEQTHPEHPGEARASFLAYVYGLYPDLDPNAECWVIEFELEDTE